MINSSAKAILTLFMLSVVVIANAQKLPGVQKGGMLLPADMKIDGKASEWNNQFQAYNKATEIYYTIANDKEMLYLVIQAKYHDVIDKILRGGITLTINHTVKKNDKEPIVITYPVLRDADMTDVANMFARKYNERRDAKNAAVPVDDLNRLFEAKSKIISLSGIRIITDPDISVYNEEKIKAVALFDTDVNYTYELAIPLKYLDLPNNGADAFSYHIKLNEPARVAGASPPPPPPPMSTTQLSATDFWAEYTLVK